MAILEESLLEAAKDLRVGIRFTFRQDNNLHTTTAQRYSLCNLNGLKQFYKRECAEISVSRCRKLLDTTFLSRIAIGYNFFALAVEIPLECLKVCGCDRIKYEVLEV